MSKIGLVVAVMVLGVGCGGAKVSQLEGELAQCKETSTTLSGEKSSLAEANAAFQAQADEMAKMEAAEKAFHDDLQSALLPLIDANKVSLSMRNGMVTVSLPVDQTFAEGKADVSKDGKTTVLEVAAALKSRDRKFVVSAHTDSRPVKEKKARFKDNWEYTTAQAYSVYALLTAAGVPADNLAVAGFGAGDPVGDNGAEEGQAQNRRVEILAMPGG